MSVCSESCGLCGCSEDCARIDKHEHIHRCTNHLTAAVVKLELRVADSRQAQDEERLARELAQKEVSQ